MNQLTNPEHTASEFEKLLAESQLNSELKEGTIIKGTVSLFPDMDYKWDKNNVEILIKEIYLLTGLFYYQF